LSNPAIAPPGTPAQGAIYVGSNDHMFYALHPDGTLWWQYECEGSVESGPAVDPGDGTVYVGSKDGYVYAFYPDRPSAPLKWSLKMPYKDIKTIPIISRDGTMIYVGSDHKGFYSINSNGVLQQTFDLDSFYRIGGVLDRAGNLYVSDHHKIVKLTPSLQELWTYPIDQNHRSHPILSPDELTVYQGSRGDDHLHAVDATTGQQQWEFKTDSNVVATGVVHPQTGAVYIGAAHGKFFAVHPDGMLKWSRSSVDGTGFRSTPTLSRDLATVYIGDEVGVFYALDAETGAIRWAFDTRTAEGRTAPIANAGPDQRVVLTDPEATLTLQGVVSDDGLPDPPARVTVKWMLDEGPDKVKLSDPKKLETTASFETPGTYTLVLTADDGENLSDDDLRVVVDPMGTEPPLLTANAGDDQVVTLPNSAMLAGIVAPGSAATLWQKVSGSGTVTFTPQASDRNASAAFSAPDVYVLRLRATLDGSQAEDDVVITVHPIPLAITITSPMAGGGISGDSSEAIGQAPSPSGGGGI